MVRLSHMLDALEVRDGLALGSIGILPVTTETPASLFTLGTYAGCSSRLAGMTWGAEDITAALGASTNREADGSYNHMCTLARTLCLAGAVAAGVQPIDTIWPAFGDMAGLAEDGRLARQRGFTGKLAIHPAQVEVINRAFTPTEDELAWSRRVVEVFENNPGLGTVGLDGKMLDMPHLKQAQRIVAMAQRAGLRQPSALGTSSWTLPTTTTSSPSAPRSRRSARTSTTTTGSSAIARAAFPTISTAPWPRPAGWASRCHRSSAAPAWASARRA